MSADLEAALATTDEVLELWADHISTHYEDCWKRHVGCLAYRINHLLKETE